MIRFKQIKELVIVDLLQANRQSNNSGSTKTINKSNLALRVLIQNGAFLLIYGLLFGTAMFNVPWPEYPGLFTQSISFMILFVLLKTFQLIFNLFYDDANLSEYLSLPFSLGELFLSKIMTIFINTFAFFLLPFVLFLILGSQAGHSLFVVIPVALALTLLIMVLMTLVPFVFIHLIHQSAFYRKHKKVFTIIIYLALFIFLFIALYTNDPMTFAPEGMVDTVPNPLFVGFHEVFIPGRMMTGWLKISLWIAVAVGLSFVIFQWAIPELYSEEQQNTAAPRKVTKNNNTGATPAMQSSSNWKVFLKYQLRQLQDTTFITQVIYTKVLLPIIFIAPTLISEGGLNLSILSELPNLWGIYLLVGVVFTILTSMEVSVSGTIISFDKENYFYIQALPISFRKYMQFKFWFAFSLDWLLGALILVGFSLFANLPGTVFLVVLVGYTLSTFIACLYFFMRDYRLLNLNWNNFTELMRRGLNQFVSLFLTFIILIATSLGTIGLAFWLFARNQPSLTLGISILILSILFLVAYGLYYYAQKKFWVKFNY